MENDTIRLLRECNAGIKMGVSTLDDVMEHVQSDSLRNLLAKSKETHTRLGNTTHEYLREYQDEGKEPAMMAKVMSKMKTNLKLDDEGPDSTAAELVTDGCNMGIKSIYRYLNQYPAAEGKIKKLAKDVAEAEESLVKDLRAYL
ncbi:hypothetical protein IMSAG185_01350 [Lachnospiraceae bacterium]|jgi:hypothetical protein|nr:hypothetical protein [Lachnospiraceae bacterium]GFI65747.1 hypothetical protein IMSAG185_01350 [Lachnospiraceae bacterium]